MELFKRQQAILSDIKKKANEPAPVEPLPEPTTANANDEIADTYEWKPNATAMERLESLALEVRFVCVFASLSLSNQLTRRHYFETGPNVYTFRHDSEEKPRYCTEISKESK